jgi:phage terminase large subunit-like protein
MDIVRGYATLEDQMCAFTSDFDRGRSGYSPDRVDAMVWALTEMSGPVHTFSVTELRI